MFLVQSYPQVPGCCRMCQGTTLPAIDTELFGEQGVQDWHWYVCRNCVRNMYQLIGGEDAHGVVSKALHDETVATLSVALSAVENEHLKVEERDAELEVLRGMVGRLTAQLEEAKDGLARSTGADRGDADPGGDGGGDGADLVAAGAPAAGRPVSPRPARRK